MEIKVEWEGIDKLARALERKDEQDYDAVVEKNIRDIYKRSQEPGGTPVGNYTGGGQMRKTARYDKDEMGYVVDYAPHVEYGHRTRNGGFVPGQYFLKKNVDKQGPIFRQDLLDALEKE